jgi:hypothetical protein
LDTLPDAAEAGAAGIGAAFFVEGGRAYLLPLESGNGNDTNDRGEIQDEHFSVGGNWRTGPYVTASFGAL